MGKQEIDSILKYGLSKCDMLFDNTPSAGLKFVFNKKEEENNYIKLYLDEAQKYNATAVYFKYFEDKPPVPQIYIYEESILVKHDINIKSLHRELWSSCKVPLFFIFSRTEIKIFNSLSKDTRTENIEPKPIEIINLASQVKDEFKAKMFDTGDFWNTTIAKQFSYNKSAYETLLTSLDTARQYLIKNSGLSKNIINSLIIKSILIRYLEEREVFEKEKEKEKYWQHFSKTANSFIEVCENTKEEKNKGLLDLLDDLSSRFNGGIFKLNEDEKEEIRNADLSYFILFLRGDINIENLQKHFWNLYSFKDLPIELISNIYELFLENERGIVYTPSILVNFMIDEIMALDNPKSNFKIIDPSCGSGIFLVGAYKRHIQWWMIQNELEKPDINTLKSILKNNIFGIDEKEEAVELAKFSLSLALCDILSPEVIWNELHFDDLSKNGNLITDDFFNMLNNEKYLGQFDLVIGNPPFISELTTKKAKEIEKKSLIENRERPKLPDNQLAFLFLEQSFKLCKKNQYVCMVQPSAFLYTNNAKSFRDYLFKKFNFRQIIDFAGLNTTLFKRKDKGADVAVSVTFMQNKTPEIETSEILHITVRQTFESREKLYFDLSYYDFHWIDYKEATSNQYIWKCNLVGGSRVTDIIKRLSQYDTLGNFLEKKVKKSQWIYLEGFMSKNSRTLKPKKSEFITGQRILPAQAFLEDGINDELIYIESADEFHRIKPKELFSPPHLLIKKKIGKHKIISEFRNDYLAFKNDTMGIHAPKNDIDNLIMLSNTLSKYSHEYLFYLMATSGKAGIDKATVLLKKDIDNLPFPDDLSKLDLSMIETCFANDVIDYMFDWIKGTKNIPIFNDVNDNQLHEYQKIYCNLLNSMYDDYKPLDFSKTKNFIVVPFYYKEKPTNYIHDCDTLDMDLENLINEKSGENINIKKVLKIYDNNIIYIIKPKQYRFWLKSIAVRDADDTFADLVDMRY